MDVYEALYTTRAMRRMKPDPVPLASQCRILDAAIRAPNGGNAQRWHFVAVDDPATKAALAQLYRRSRDDEWADIAAGRLGRALPEHQQRHAASVERLKRSGDAFTEHFADIPLLLCVFAAGEHVDANTFPAIWSALLAARAEGIGGVLTTVLDRAEAAVRRLLEVPRDGGWKLVAMLAFGYPRGRWGVAADRHPVHEVSSRNRWGGDFGATVPEPLWPGSGRYRVGLEGSCAPRRPTG